MEDKKRKIKSPSGREMDLGIYANLSSAGLETLQRMMNETSPGKKKKKAVRRTK